MARLHLHSGQAHPALSTFRLTLRQALINAGELPAWTESYADDPSTPPELRFDKRVVMRQTADHTSPTLAQFTTCLQSDTPRWGQAISRVGQLSIRFLAALFIAFFPKCPFCWAAYLSYIGATGVSAVPYQPGLIYVLMGLLMTNIAVLYWTRYRHGWGPFWLCVAGALLIGINWMWFDQTALLVLGLSSLCIGSLWNSLSQKMTDSLTYYVNAGWHRLASPNGNSWRRHIQ